MEVARDPKSRWSLVLQALRGALTGDDMDFGARLSRARFRAWHRGTREADYLIGSYFDRHHESWDEDDLDWFERLIEEEDADVMAWALRAQPVPDRLAGRQMTVLQQVDYVSTAR